MGVRITCSIPFDDFIDQAVANIRQEVESRSYDAANELRNSALEILRGQRGGRRYRVPGKKVYYTASAPGEPPAARSGLFRISWQPTALKEGNTYISRVESDLEVGTKKTYLLGEILEKGTPGGQMAPRPHQEKILQDAEPRIFQIYSAPYD